MDNHQIYLIKILEMFVQALNYHLIDKKSWLNFLTFSFIIFPYLIYSFHSQNGNDYIASSHPKMYKSKYLLAAMSSKIDAVLNYFKISPLNNRKVMEFYKSAVHQAVGMRDDTDKVRERERQTETDRQTGRQRENICVYSLVYI